MIPGVILLSIIYEQVMNWNTIYFLTVHYSLFDLRSLSPVRSLTLIVTYFTSAVPCCALRHFSHFNHSSFHDAITT
jgi:hypothetical protein